MKKRSINGAAIEEAIILLVALVAAVGLVTFFSTPKKRVPDAVETPAAAPVAPVAAISPEAKFKEEIESFKKLWSAGESLATSHAGEVQEKVDHFTGSTDISLKNEIICSSLNKTTYGAYVIVIKDWNKPVFYWHWTHADSDWRWLKYHPVRLLVDGSLWEFNPSLDHEVMDGPTCYERVGVELSLQQMKTLALARKVEVEVGVDELRFTQSDHEKLLIPFAVWLYHSK